MVSVLPDCLPCLASCSLLVQWLLWQRWVWRITQERGMQCEFVFPHLDLAGMSPLGAVKAHPGPKNKDLLLRPLSEATSCLKVVAVTRRRLSETQDGASGDSQPHLSCLVCFPETVNIGPKLHLGTHRHPKKTNKRKEKKGQRVKCNVVAQNPTTTRTLEAVAPMFPSQCCGSRGRDPLPPTPRSLVSGCLCLCSSWAFV